METAALITTGSTSHCPASAHGHARRRRAAACSPRRRQPCGMIRALPSAEVINEILSPKLVPGSPADIGDVSALIPVSAVMLLFYFVSNWVVPELLMKQLKDKPGKPEDEAAASASMSADDATASPRKIRLKVKKKNGKSTIVKV